MVRKLLGDDEIRRKFLSLMERLGWTKADVARQLGVEKSLPGKWLKEDGGRRIPEPHLVKMAGLAGEDPSYFFPDPTGPKDPERAEKLLVATYLERYAAQLREEAAPTSDVGSSADAAEASRQAHRLADKGEGESRVQGE